MWKFWAAVVTHGLLDVWPLEKGYGWERNNGWATAPVNIPAVRRSPGGSKPAKSLALLHDKTAHFFVAGLLTVCRK